MRDDDSPPQVLQISYGFHSTVFNHGRFIVDALVCRLTAKAGLCMQSPHIYRSLNNPSGKPAHEPKKHPPLYTATRSNTNPSRKLPNFASHRSRQYAFLGRHGPLVPARGRSPFPRSTYVLFRSSTGTTRMLPASSHRGTAAVTPSLRISFSSRHTSCAVASAPSVQDAFV